MIIKRADKRPCVVLLDREDYLVELGKQLQDADIYEDTDFKEYLSGRIKQYDNSIS